VRSILTILLMLSMVLSISGQGRCVIEGRVTDPISGESLPGVNVMIKGSYYGSATDLDGRFRLTGMSPGTYDIEFSMIGYKVVLKTNTIVTIAEPAYVEIELEQTTLALGQEVVVEGERPLFEVDQTASSVRLTADDLKMNIVENVGDVLAEQAGITSQDNEIHIRGGRVDESMFIVDGMSVKDPLSGSANNLYLNVDAIEELEVITGGFNAEYGQAMSGIINIRIKEGSEVYHGTFSYSSDHFGLKDLPWDAFTKDRVEFTLSGPEVFTGAMSALGLKLPGQFSFFLNGYMHINDSYLPRADDLVPSQSWMESLATRQQNDWHGLYKLTWRINSQQKLSVSYDYSLNINQGWGFPYRYQNILTNFNTITKESILSSMLYTHTLSSNSSMKSLSVAFLPIIIPLLKTNTGQSMSKPLTLNQSITIYLGLMGRSILLMVMSSGIMVMPLTGMITTLITFPLMQISTINHPNATALRQGSITSNQNYRSLISIRPGWENPVWVVIMTSGI